MKFLLVSFLTAFAFSPSWAEEAPCGKSKYLRCGSVDVPKDHGDFSKGSFKLKYEIARRDHGQPRRTLVILPGGPGSNAEYLRQAGFVRALFRQFDLFFLHSRGSDSEHFTKKDLNDPAIVHPIQQAHDLNWIRQSYFGGEKLSLYGHSFGAMAATFYARTYSEYLESAVLHSGIWGTKRVDSIYSFGVTLDLDALLSVKRIRDASYAKCGRSEYLELISQIEKKISDGQFDYLQGENLRQVKVQEFRPFLVMYLETQREGACETLRLIRDLDPAAHLNFQKALNWFDEVNYGDYRDAMICRYFLSEKKARVLREGGAGEYCEYEFEGGNRELFPPSLKPFEEVKAPVLIAFGEMDFKTPSETELEPFERFANSETLIVPGATHYAYDERPEWFGQRIVDFLNRNSQR